jgi:hypothetical protein
LKLIKNLRYPLAGWIAGVVIIFGLISVWPSIFPGMTNTTHYETPPVPMQFILGATLVVATPAALVGGLIGSRLPREGGATEQTIVAALVGAILALPFGCASLWVFSGS